MTENLRPPYVTYSSYKHGFPKSPISIPRGGSPVLQIDHQPYQVNRSQETVVIAVHFGDSFTKLLCNTFKLKDGESKPNIGIKAPQQSLTGLLLQQQLFQASEIAYQKLLAAAGSCSGAYREFLRRLGNHEQVLHRGEKAFESLLDHRTPSSLEDVYSFLHRSFAVSQIEIAPPGQSSPAEFRKNIDALRKCLSGYVQVRDENIIYIYKEADVFDEILTVMGDEIKQAVSWLWKNEYGGQLMKNLALNMKTLHGAYDILESGVEISNTSYTASHDTHPKREMSEHTTEPQSWLDIVIGPIFSTVFLVTQMILHQVSTRINEAQYASTALYSFLLDNVRNSDNSNFTENKNYAFIATVEDRMFKALPTTNEKLCKAMYSGVYLLSEGLIHTLRQLEEYVLKLEKVLCKTSTQSIEYKGGCWEYFAGCLTPGDIEMIDWSESLPSRFANPYTQALLECPDIDVPDADEFSPSGVVDSANTANPPESDSVRSSPSADEKKVPGSPTIPMLVDELTAGSSMVFCNLGKCKKKPFSTSCNLLRHQRNCHGVRNYPCGVGNCGYGSGRMDNLWRHRYRAHGVSEPAKGARLESPKIGKTRHKSGVN